MNSAEMDERAVETTLLIGTDLIEPDSSKVFSLL